MDKDLEKKLVINDLLDNLRQFKSETLHRCPCCEKIIEWDDVNYNPEERTYTCPHCNNTFDENELENISIYDYIEEIYLTYKTTIYRENLKDE